MPVRIFLSFDHGDADQVNGLRGLLENPNHDLTGDDRSLKEPVTYENGQPILLLPTDPRAEPVRKKIRELFDQASRMVVLIGQNTHSSLWVNWEIDDFHRRKSDLGGVAARRIYAMRLKGSRGGAPAALARVGAGPVHEWDPDALARWLDTSV